jgi:hypothetical protein
MSLSTLKLNPDSDLTNGDGNSPFSTSYGGGGSSNSNNSNGVNNNPFSDGSSDGHSGGNNQGGGPVIANPTGGVLGDLLTLDKPIAGQAWTCMSFVTPTKILKDKNLFFFEEFLKGWDFAKSMEKYAVFLHFLSYKYRLDQQEIMTDFEEFVTTCKQKLINDTMENEYQAFLDKREEELELRFKAKHPFTTTVMAVKERGNYSTKEEANLRAKMLQEADPAFTVLVGPVGQWLMWDPDAYKTGNVHHLEPELNRLVHEKEKNETLAKAAFDQRVKDTKIRAVAENKARAEKSGNKVTQDVRPDGTLVDATTTSTPLPRTVPK